MDDELKNGCIYTKQFANDQVVTVNDIENMQYMIRKLVKEYNM